MQHYKLRTFRYIKLNWFDCFRTSNDIQVLEHCEIHPIRTEFVSDLGEGAFGRVHKAKLKDGLDFFTNTDDSVNGNGQQKIVAVKELHGKCALMNIL